MVDQMLTALWTLADYSNWLSVLLILLCFFCMSVFIVRLNGNQLVQRTPILPGTYIPAQAMTGVYNPFVFSLCNLADASVNEGVEVEVTSQEDCQMFTFWGADIAETFHFMHRNWSQLRRELAGKLELSHRSLFTESTLIHLPCDRQRYHLRPPEGGLELGPPPRHRYPLVVVLMATRTEDLPDDHVVMMVSLVHLRDDQCPGASHMIYQYVRTATGRPYNLKHLYLSQDGADSTPVRNETREPAQEQAGSCVVCQMAPVCRVLLPCRHACVCHGCFSKLDRCPMCRGTIMTYFELCPSEPKEEAPSLEGLNWWEKFNHRLNEYFGFT